MKFGILTKIKNTFSVFLSRKEREKDNLPEWMRQVTDSPSAFPSVLTGILSKLRKIFEVNVVGASAAVVGAVFAVITFLVASAAWAPEQGQAVRRMFLCWPVAGRFFADDCDPQVWAQRSQEAADRNDGEAAVRLISRAISIAPETASFYNWRGHILMNLPNKSADAHRDFDEALQLQPNMFYALYNDGLVYAKEGAREAARARYDAAIAAASPQIFSSAYEYRGLLSVVEGKYKAAISDLDVAIANGVADAEAFRARGRAYLKIGDPTAGISNLEKAAQLDSSSVDILLDLSAACLDNKLDDKALDYANRAVQIDPKNPAAYNNRGVAYRHLHKMDEAESDLKEAIDLDPNSVAALTNLGDVYADQYDYSRSIPFYERALKIDAGNVFALRKMSVAQAMIGKSDQAIQNATGANIVDPSSLVGQLLVANAHLLMGRTKKSQDEFNDALARDPHSSLALTMRCSSLISTGRFADGVKDCDAALSLNPRDTFALTLRCLANGSHTGETSDCDSAIRIDGQLAFPYAVRALLKIQSRAYDQALADARRAVLISNKDALSQAVLGLAYLTKSDFRSARDSSKDSIDLNPAPPLAYLVHGAASFYLSDRPTALSDLSEMRKRANANKLFIYAAADLEFRFQDYRDAAEDSDEAIRLGFKNATVFIEGGIAHGKLGNFDRAIQLFTDAMDADTSSPVPYLFRGQLYKQLGQQEAARSDFVKARQLSKMKNGDAVQPGSLH